MGIRNAAKALLIHDNKLLLNKNQNSIGDMCYGLPNGAIYYDLPGGGQNQYETLEEAVKRECLEETGYHVEVLRLAAVFEEISRNQDLRKHYEQYAHKVYFVFVCRLLDLPLEEITDRDLDLMTSEWIDLDCVTSLPLYPSVLTKNLRAILSSDSLVHLGTDYV